MMHWKGRAIMLCFVLFVTSACFKSSESTPDPCLLLTPADSEKILDRSMAQLAHLALTHLQSGSARRFVPCRPLSRLMTPLSHHFGSTS